MRKSSQNRNQDLPKALSEALVEVSFTPKDAHRRAKSSLWAKIGDDPLVDTSSMTAASAAKYVGDSRILSWWSEPGFKEWFLNRDEIRERLDYLVSKSLEAAEEIISNDDPKAQSARVNMIKALIDWKQKQDKSASESKFLDSSIQSMDRLQLEAFLQKQGVSLSLSGSKNSRPEPNPEKETIDVTPESN